MVLMDDITPLLQSPLHNTSEATEQQHTRETLRWSRRVLTTLRAQWVAAPTLLYVKLSIDPYSPKRASLHPEQEEHV